MTQSQPAIVLVRPQLGENIGSSARAMWNCGLDDLRVVAPRDGWPNAKARASATGALHVVDRARVFPTVEEAIGDLGFVVATSARERDMLNRGIELSEAMAQGRRQLRNGSGTGFLFGPERTGLDNDDLTLASRTLKIPLNPRFQSLNLAQAVLLVSWSWLQTETSETIETVGRQPHLSHADGGDRDRVEEGGEDAEDAEDGAVPQGRAGSRAADAPLADGESLANLFQHMERELDQTNFFRVPERRYLMIRKLRAILQRADLREHEVQTLHGVVSALVGRRKDGQLVGPGRKFSEPREDSVPDHESL